MIKVVIVDYGLGNLYSVSKACHRTGFSATVSSEPDVVRSADAIILPGVGAFGDAMSNLQCTGMDSEIRQFAATGKPIFGICLGLQLLFDASEEFGDHRGLCIIEGTVNRLRLDSLVPQGRELKIPHVGWNSIEAAKGHNLKNTPLEGLERNDLMYFVHSYCVAPKKASDCLTETEYGNVRFCSSILRSNIFACQFHPEKSGEAGLRIYENWYKAIKKKD